LCYAEEKQERKSGIMRLLYAEDEKSLARAVSAILTKSNYSVDVVHDGEAALDYLATENYDGVILDVMMPKLDGIEVLRRMRAAGDRTPVLLLTAKSEIDDRVTGLDSGANDYLTKPFDMKELLARIRAMTRVQGLQTDKTLSFGNVTLDCSSYDLRGPGGSHKLAGKEYQMLEMLMRNPRTLVSTEAFMDRIWGYDSEAELNSVWVYISTLRKKLKSIDANVEIRAQRGVGYYLEVSA
jgi:DNA-binding response OmpR family regulator